MTLIKSQLVLNAALRNKDVSNYQLLRKQKDPIGWLQENLKVGFINGSEVMEISLTGDDPREVAGVVNAVKKSYVDEIVDVDTKRRADRHQQLKKLKATYGKVLKEKRETLRKLAESVGTRAEDRTGEKKTLPILYQHLRTSASRSGWNRQKRKLFWRGGRSPRRPRQSRSARRLPSSKIGSPS